MKKFGFWKILAGILAAALLTGCGAAEQSADALMSRMGEAEVSSPEVAAAYEDAGYAEGANSAGEYLPAGRKLVRNYTIDVETREFDRFRGDLLERLASVQGYVESSNDYMGAMGEEAVKYAEIVLRVPKAQAAEFLAWLGDAAHITRRSEQVEDITLQYVDSQSRQKALETEQARLMELLAQAASLEEVILLEERLSQVRYELESAASTLRLYDNMVDFDTLHLQIQEVVELTPVAPLSLGQRMAEGFAMGLQGAREALEGLLVWLATTLPYWLMLAAMIIVLAMILRLITRVRIRQRQRAQEQKSAQSGPSEVEK